MAQRSKLELVETLARTETRLNVYTEIATAAMLKEVKRFGQFTVDNETTHVYFTRLTRAHGGIVITKHLIGNQRPVINADYLDSLQLEASKRAGYSTPSGQYWTKLAPMLQTISRERQKQLDQKV